MGLVQFVQPLISLFLYLIIESSVEKLGGTELLDIGLFRVYTCSHMMMTKFETGLETSCVGEVIRLPLVRNSPVNVD